MYYCHECENFFTESEIEEKTFGTGVYAPDGYEEHFTADVCPHCGSDELEEVNECPICGDPCLPDEHFCDNCKQEMRAQLTDTLSEWAVRHRVYRRDIAELMEDVLEGMLYGKERI